MSIKSFVLSKFWDKIRVSDEARLAVQPLPDGVTESNDHSYIDDGNIYHRLDVYYPDGAEDKLPVIIDIHGGGWMYGDKELNKRYCMELSKRGFTVFNLSYRLCPDVTMWMQLQDVFSAFKWIDEHLEQFPCDRDRIFVTGDSAGGQLSAFSAVINGNSGLMEDFGLCENSITFKAVGLVSPVAYMSVGVTSLYASLMLGKNYKAMPYGRFSGLDSLLEEAGTMPPTYIVTSSGDILARAQTHKAYDCIRQNGGIPCVIKDWPRTGGKYLPHVFSVMNPFDEAGKICIDEMTSFFIASTKQAAFV